MADFKSSVVEDVDISAFCNRPIHSDVAAVIWLHGKWRTEDGKGTLPNLPSFTYSEELLFTSVGQAGLNYSAFSWSKDKTMPLHQESGFLRVKSDSNRLAFIISHNSGIAVIEEGEVNDTTISLTSCSVSRMSFSRGPAVLSTKREFRLKSDTELEQILYMCTSDSPSLTQHLTAIYRKID